MTDLRKKMSNIQSIMQLDRINVIEFSIKFNEKIDTTIDQDEDDSSIIVDFEPQVADDMPLKHRLFLDFHLEKTSEKSLIDQLHFKVYGYFTFFDDLGKEKMNQFLVFNGLAMLYSMMRTHILQLSAMTDYRVMLPTLDVSKLVKDHYEMEKTKNPQ